jgi:SAM-dependent methyltransferase
MPLGYIKGLRLLHRAFRRYPAGHRLHVLIRYFTCPFTRTVDDVPAGSRVLEIGSGHSAYGVLIEDRIREVVAVEPDLRKSLLPSPSKKIRKVAGFDDCVRGNDFDAAVVYDVTYRMPVEVRKALFARLFQRLRPGGTLVFKDMDSDHRWKMKWARLQEWLSDHLLHISIGEGFIYQSPADIETMLREIGFTGFEARAIDRGYPHPHMIFTARKPG